MANSFYEGFDVPAHAQEHLTLDSGDEDGIDYFDRMRMRSLGVEVPQVQPTRQTNQETENIPAIVIPEPQRRPVEPLAPSTADNDPENLGRLAMFGNKRKVILRRSDLPPRPNATPATISNNADDSRLRRSASVDRSHTKTKITSAAPPPKPAPARAPVTRSLATVAASVTQPVKRPEKREMPSIPVNSSQSGPVTRSRAALLAQNDIDVSNATEAMALMSVKPKPAHAVLVPNAEGRHRGRERTAVHAALPAAAGRKPVLVNRSGSMDRHLQSFPTEDQFHRDLARRESGLTNHLRPPASSSTPKSREQLASIARANPTVRSRSSSSTRTRTTATAPASGSRSTIGAPRLRTAQRSAPRPAAASGARKREPSVPRESVINPRTPSSLRRPHQQQLRSYPTPSGATPRRPLTVPSEHGLPRHVDDLRREQKPARPALARAALPVDVVAPAARPANPRRSVFARLATPKNVVVRKPETPQKNVIRNTYTHGLSVEKRKIVGGLRPPTPVQQPTASRSIANVLAQEAGPSNAREMTLNEQVQ